MGKPLGPTEEGEGELIVERLEKFKGKRSVRKSSEEAMASQ